MKKIAYIGLSSNIGCCFEILDKAINLLLAEPKVNLLAASRRYFTNPLGVLEPMPDFLNQVIKISYSGAGARELLFEILFKIENQLGRTRAGNKALTGPLARTLDLDLLLFGKRNGATGAKGSTGAGGENGTNWENWNLPELTLPHARMLERAFVLVPLLEIWNDSEVFPVFTPCSEVPENEQKGRIYLKQCLNKLSYQVLKSPLAGPNCPNCPNCQSCIECTARIIQHQ